MKVRLLFSFTQTSGDLPLAEMFLSELISLSIYRWTLKPAYRYTLRHKCGIRAATTLPSSPPSVSEFTCCYATSRDIVACATNVCAWSRQRRRVSTAPLSTVAAVADRQRNRRYRIGQGCVPIPHPSVPGYHFFLVVHRMLNKDKMIPGYTWVGNRNTAQTWNRHESHVISLTLIFPMYLHFVPMENYVLHIASIYKFLFFNYWITLLKKTAGKNTGGKLRSGIFSGGLISL